MTKEQAQEIWEAVNKAIDDAGYADAKMQCGSLQAWEDAADDARFSWNKVKELLTKYTGHEVE